MRPAFEAVTARAGASRQASASGLAAAQRRFTQGLAAARALLGRDPRRGLVFHHIPKCAGSAIALSMRQHYAPWQYRAVPSDATVQTARFFDPAEAASPAASRRLTDAHWVDVHAYRLRLLHTFLTNGARAVGGHIAYHPGIHEQFQHSHSFVTILRDPVERFVSQYFYTKHAHSYVRLPADFDDDDLEAVGPVWGSMITFFLGAGAELESAAAGDAADRWVPEAKRTLERLPVVGFVDDMDAFRRRLADTIGVRIDIGRRNVRPRRDDRDEERWIREVAPRFCAPDLEVYAHARAVRAEAPAAA